MQRDKVLSLIGLAMKAGKCVSGEFMTEREVKSGKACLVMAAADASDNTKKKFENMCAYYQVRLRSFLTKEELGRAIGKEYRACLAVLDENLARAIGKELNEK